MAVKIRLARRGRKKLATYDVIVADARSPRDGRIIEKLGTYSPLSNPAAIVINEDKALDWLMKGAQPTDTARRILSHKGILLKKHLQIGVLKEAITQEQADSKFADWQKVKEAEISGNIDSLAKIKADEAKARLEAEKKVNEAKAEALKKKLAALVPAEEAPETAAEENTVKETPVVAETADRPSAPVVEKTTKTEETKADDKAEPAKTEEKVEEVKADATEESVVESKEAPAKVIKDEPVAETKAEEIKNEPVVEAKTEEKVEEAKVEKAEAEEPVAKKDDAPVEGKKEEEKK